MQKTVLVDFSWLWNRSLYAFKDLADSEGNPTGGLVGVLKFHELVRNKDLDKIICLDDFSAKRKELYPEYKANREVDEFRLKAKKSNSDLLKALKFLGWKILKKEGYEADDIIAMKALQLAQQGQEVIIYSSDKDMQQLMVYPNIKISCSIDKGDFVYKTEQDVIDKLGVPPSLSRWLRPMRGDSSDNITSAAPRVNSKYLIPIAESIAKDIVSNPNLEEVYTNAVAKAELTPKARAVLTESKATYLRNFQLMDLLQHAYCKEEVPECDIPLINEDEFYAILDKYSLNDFKGKYLEQKIFVGV